MTHDEDWLETLYWEFDNSVHRGGDERLKFKAFLRAYGTKCAQEAVDVMPKPIKIGLITDYVKDMVLRQEVMLFTDNYLPIGTALYTWSAVKQPRSTVEHEVVDGVIKSVTITNSGSGGFQERVINHD